MRKVFGLGALGLAALGTTLWAQSGDDPPAKRDTPSAAAAGTSPDTGDQPARPYDAGEVKPAQPPSTTPADAGNKKQPRPSARAAAPGFRAAGGPAAAGGPMPTAGAGPAVGPAVAGPGPAIGTYGGGAQPAYGYPATNYPTPYNLYTTAPQYSQPGQYPSNPPVQYFIQSDNNLPLRAAEDAKSAQEFRETIEQLRAAKTDEEKAEARETLNKLVAKQLDEDMAQREKRLDELEAKTKQLREQLKQRKETKDEIQKMLVMLIENPQGGLGLPQSWMNVINSQPVYNVPTWQHSYSTPSEPARP